MDEVSRTLRPGWELFSAGRFDRSLEVARRCLAQEPEAVEALRLQAASLFHLRRYAEALAACDQIIAGWPEDAYAWYHRTASLINLPDPAAEEACQRLLELDQEDPDAWYLRSCITVGGDRGRNLTDIDRALELDPERTDFLRRRAEIQQKMGDRAGAEQTFRRILTVEPDNSEVMMQLGDLLLERRESIDAYQPYLGAARTDPQQHADTVRDSLERFLTESLKAFCFTPLGVIVLWVWPWRMGAGGTLGTVMAVGPVLLLIIPAVRFAVRAYRRIPRHFLGGYLARRPLLVGFAATMLVFWFVTLWFVLTPGDAKTAGLLPFACSLLLVLLYAVAAMLVGLGRLGVRLARGTGPRG